MNLSAPQCILEFLCLVLVNKESPSPQPTQRKQKTNISKASITMQKGLPHVFECVSPPSRNRPYTFALINFYCQAQQNCGTKADVYIGFFRIEFPKAEPIVAEDQRD